MKKSTMLVLVMVIAFSLADFPVNGQILWTRDAANPVLSGSGDGIWDNHVFMPDVLYNADSARFEMWYGGSRGNVQNSWRPYRIGFATSPDGINWTKHPEFVMEPDSGSWEESTVEGQIVIRENKQYKMWYSGWSETNPEGGIGYATSLDGINWTKYEDNPVLGEAGSESWELGGPGYCSVIATDEGYKMWYTAGPDENWASSNIGYATSEDGISWVRDTLNNPVLSHAPVNKWDNPLIGQPKVIMVNDVYHMSYTGMRTNGDERRIGWAVSNDGINWYKYDNPLTDWGLYEWSDPVLIPNPGQWDGSFVESGTIMLIGDSLHAWYSGVRFPSATYKWRIGHATVLYDSVYKYTVLGINEDDYVYIPEGISLWQNYPNPFNPATKITFSIPISQSVKLDVCNSLGQIVGNLVEDKLQAGSHEVEFNASHLPSGVYFYRLQAGAFVDTKKMLLIK